MSASRASTNIMRCLVST
uniref:Uncharacterized protein n=1 Tax=Anguilla anguilla TaxID=7936 RepID=A0A0E9TDS9_ANGAN